MGKKFLSPKHQFLEVLDCALDSDQLIPCSGMTSGVHVQCYRITFFDSFLSSPILSCSQVHCASRTKWSETWFWCSITQFLWLPLPLEPSVKIKVIGALSPLLSGPQDCWSQGKVPFSSLRSCPNFSIFWRPGQERKTITIKSNMKVPLYSMTHQDHLPTCQELSCCGCFGLCSAGSSSLNSCRKVPADSTVSWVLPSFPSCMLSFIFQNLQIIFMYSIKGF